jgi:D-3-phosphoglycerate dehydrogenase
MHHFASFVESAKPQLLIAEASDFNPAALELLRATFAVELADCTRQELLNICGDYQVIWVRLRHNIDREVFARAPGLRCVVTNTTGLNHLDLVAAAERGIRIVSLRGETDFLKEIRGTAELTLALTLALLRKLPQASAHVNAGGWNRDQFRGREIHGKTVGIVGYGRLGRITASYFAALGALVLACGPDLRSSEVEPGVTVVSMAELLERSEIVSLHANLTAASAGFFAAAAFQRMKPASYFINTARGELVDEAALLAALEQEKIAGAALDVLAGESSSGMAHHPLVRYAGQHDNLLLTPHIGGNTWESRMKTELFLAGQLTELWPQFSKN